VERSQRCVRLPSTIEGNDVEDHVRNKEPEFKISYYSRGGWRAPASHEGGDFPLPGDVEATLTEKTASGGVLPESCERTRACFT